MHHLGACLYEIPQKYTERKLLTVYNMVPCKLKPARSELTREIMVWADVLV